MAGQKKLHPENHTPWIPKGPTFAKGDDPRRFRGGSKPGRKKKKSADVDEALRREALEHMVTRMRNADDPQSGWAAKQVFEWGRGTGEKGPGLDSEALAVFFERLLSDFPSEIRNELLDRVGSALAALDAESARSNPAES